MIWVSLAISTIFDNLTERRAASSRSETGKILRPEAAIKTLPSSTRVPCEFKVVRWVQQKCLKAETRCKKAETKKNWVCLRKGYHTSQKHAFVGEKILDKSKKKRVLLILFCTQKKLNKLWMSLWNLAIRSQKNLLFNTGAVTDNATKNLRREKIVSFRTYCKSYKSHFLDVINLIPVTWQRWVSSAWDLSQLRWCPRRWRRNAWCRRRCWREWRSPRKNKG